LDTLELVTHTPQDWRDGIENMLSFFTVKFPLFAIFKRFGLVGMLLLLIVYHPWGNSQKPLFEEIPPAQSGISWVHENARSEKRDLPETLGPGCAFFDYDNDGWMDIYLVNYGPCDFFKPVKPLQSALYRNNHDGTFTDVTAEAGVGGNVFGMGAVVGDYDNDGFADLLVTAYGSHPILYHNNGDGTFSDKSSQSGIATDSWTTSAVWFDYDNDGVSISFCAALSITA
jgi:hypothetical protein